MEDCNGTILAVSDERRELVRQAAIKLMDNIKNNVRPRDIVTKEAIDDAFALDMAMGGSTNSRRSSETARIVPLPGRARPKTSIKQFIELAVNIPEHEPQVGQAFFSK